MHCTNIVVRHAYRERQLVKKKSYISRPPKQTEYYNFPESLHCVSTYIKIISRMNKNKSTFPVQVIDGSYLNQPRTSIIKNIHCTQVGYICIINFNVLVAGII